MSAQSNWRGVYRSKWMHLSSDELRAHLEAAQGVLARLDASQGYFVTLWRRRVAELKDELNCPERLAGKTVRKSALRNRAAALAGQKNGRKNGRKNA